MTAGLWKSGDCGELTTHVGRGKLSIISIPSGVRRTWGSQSVSWLRESSMTAPLSVDTTPLYRIRLADWNSPEDSQAIGDLLNSYAQLPIGCGEPLSAEVRARIVPGLRSLRGAFAVIAYQQDEPVGLAICLEGFSTFAAQPLINIHDLVVIPEHQGQGIGTQLLRSVEAHARSLGCCKVTLEVRVENVCAKKLYHRLGYADPGGMPTLMLERLL